MSRCTFLTYIFLLENINSKTDISMLFLQYLLDFDFSDISWRIESSSFWTKIMEEEKRAEGDENVFTTAIYTFIG